MKTFRKGGIHPDPCKITADVPTRAIPAPEVYTVLLSQNIGAPARPVVKPGDMVKQGDLLAEAGGFVSANIHSPADATVKKIEKVRNFKGLWQDAIILEAKPDEAASEYYSAEENDLLLIYPGHYNPVNDPKNASPKDIIDAVGNMGVVGLGGATFPTRVKLSIPESKSADTIIINGAECEPYLTCDDRLMRAYANEILCGTELLMRATGAERAIVGIEENKPQAIKAMTEAAANYYGIRVETLRARYPQGSEKQLIEALTGRRVPAGSLPVDAGCVVDNVATAFAVFQAVAYNIPLTRRIVTVSGRDVKRPGNYLVNIGTPLQHIIDAAGGLPETTGKVIAGGPMMGAAVSQLSAPSTKGLSGIVIMPEDMSTRHEAGPCVRCARCVSACPMGLEPYLLQLLSQHQRFGDCRAQGVLNCIECGCCSYSCPSARPLLDYIRLAKNELRKKPKN